MDNRVETGRESWRAVLRAGGAAAIPRWTLDPAPGVAEHVATLDDDLAAGVRRLAYELELPLHSVALAAHAKVLAALSGEQDVVIGYAARPGGRPLPCPLTTEARSRRSLLQDTAQVESDLLQHRDFAVDELKRELGVAGPAFETEFDRIGSLDTGGKISTDLAEDAVLRVALATPGGRLALHLHYRTDALDAGSAERIAGYQLTALALMVADPGAEHGRASLPSDEEPRFQLDRLAGAAPGAAGPPVPRAVRAARADAPGRRRGRAPQPAAVDLPGAQRTPTSWRGRCWRVACAARAWSRW